VNKTSAQQKFEWGVKHLNAVCAEAKAFEHGKSYVLRIKREVRSSEEIAYDCFAVPKKPLPDHWPLLLGDAVQNIRNSLDHAVYTTAKGKGRTQFPIFEDPCEFQVKGGKDIATVPAAIRAIIKQAQPFNTIVGRPSSDALAVLADLSNHDKHRNITAAVSYIGIPWLGTDPGVDIQFTGSGEGKPLAPDKETYVVSFIVRGPEAEKMNVNPDFAYEVFIERVRRDRKTIEWVSLATALEVIASRVGVVLDAVENGKPLGVWLRPAV
jgi:hypothetical protein